MSDRAFLITKRRFGEEINRKLRFGPGSNRHFRLRLSGVGYIIAVLWTVQNTMYNICSVLYKTLYNSLELIDTIFLIEQSIVWDKTQTVLFYVSFILTWTGHF